MDQTINDVFARQSKRYGNRLAIEKKTNGQWHQATWAQYYERARETGLGLTHLGIRKGDRVGLWAPNYAEWTLVQFATAEIGRLLPHGRGIQERVITIGGPAIRKKGNYRIPIGTPLRFALEYVGMDDHLSRVFLGGPMMGQALPSLDIPITKGTSGVVAFTESETELTYRKVYPCIRCGYCVDACPIFLNPSQLGILAEAAEHQRMADVYAQDLLEYADPSYFNL